MRTKSMSGGSFLGEMKNLGISIGKDIVRESAPLVKDMLKAKIQKRLSADSGKGLYAANVGRGRGRMEKWLKAHSKTVNALRSVWPVDIPLPEAM